MKNIIISVLIMLVFAFSSTNCFATPAEQWWEEHGLYTMNGRLLDPVRMQIVISVILAFAALLSAVTFKSVGQFFGVVIALIGIGFNILVAYLFGNMVSTIIILVVLLTLFIAFYVLLAKEERVDRLRREHL